MLTAYSRVTVVSGTRKIDLALPSGLPVADVVPQVLRFCVPADDVETPTAWTLARIGGVPLPLTQTLAEAGVLDGEVLELRHPSSNVGHALVEDVRDVVEDGVDAAGGTWTPATTVSFAIVASAVVLTVLALATVAGALDVEGSSASVIATSATAVLAALALTAWGALSSAGWVAQLSAAVALVWAFLTGASIGDSQDLTSPVRTLVAVSLVLVTAAAVRGFTPSATPHVAVGVIVFVTGVTYAVADLAGVDTAQVLRLAPVLAVLACGVLPRLSLSVGGLASADYRVRHAGRLTTVGLAARYRHSNGLLIGSLVAVALVVVWGSVWMTFSAAPWDRYLALSVAVAALLRSRVFSRIAHLLPLRVAATVVLAFQVVRLTEDQPQWRPFLVVVFVLAILVLVAVSSAPMSVVTRARVKRALNLAEFFVVVDMVVVAGGALGVFGAISAVAS